MRRMVVLLLALALVASGAAALLHTHDAAAQGPESQGGPGKPGSPGGPGNPPVPANPNRPGLPTGPGASGPAAPPEVFDWNRARAESLVARMLDEIKGKENMPAESVYKNIKILNGMPAKRLPGIMAMGFSRSLGMRCGGCHERDNFPSDARPQKRVAREMWAMTQDLNKRVLPGIKELDTEMPTVNCWTCHRGHRVPELNPDEPPKGQQAPPKPESSH